jgi:AbrB family looped-hinge helix DNA binding protein
VPHGVAENAGESVLDVSNTEYSYLMRVTQKGQVTIPQEVRRALGIEPGTEVDFRLERDGARLVVDRGAAPAEVARMRGAGDVDLSTEEILALTRR